MESEGEGRAGEGSKSNCTQTREGKRVHLGLNQTSRLQFTKSHTKHPTATPLTTTHTPLPHVYNLSLGESVNSVSGKVVAASVAFLTWVYKQHLRGKCSGHQLAAPVRV